MDKKEREFEFCKRCGRKLKTDEARRIGYGPICAKKAKKLSKYKLF